MFINVNNFCLTPHFEGIDEIKLKLEVWVN